MVNKTEISVQRNVFDAVTVAAGGTARTTQLFAASGVNKRGYFSLQATVTGAGTLSLYAEVSLDGGTTWSRQSPTTNIATGVTAGNAVYGVTFPVAPAFRIVAEETGGVSTATITAHAASQ